MKYKVGDFVLLKNQMWFHNKPEFNDVIHEDMGNRVCIKDIDGDVYKSQHSSFTDDCIDSESKLYSIGQHVKLKPCLYDNGEIVMITGIQTMKKNGITDIWYSHQNGSFVEIAIDKTADIQEELRNEQSEMLAREIESTKPDYQLECYVLSKIIEEKDKLIKDLLDRLHKKPEKPELKKDLELERLIISNQNRTIK